MKQIRVWLACIIIAATAMKAQPSNDIEFSLNSGFVFPSSPMSFSNYWKMQYGGGAGVGIALTPSVTIEGAFEYYRFILDQKGIDEGFNTPYMRDIWIFNDVSLQPSADPSSVMTLAVNVRVVPSGLSGPVSPYFLAGAGVMQFSLSEISLPTKSSIALGGSNVTIRAEQRIFGGDETVPFFQYGVGFNFHVVESFKVFAEVRYTKGLTKGLGVTYLPIVAGVKFGL